MNIPHNDIASQTSKRDIHAPSDEAVLLCKAGKAALKANLLDKAIRNFRRALSLNPMIWEAFEGLCAAGIVAQLMRYRGNAELV